MADVLTAKTNLKTVTQRSYRQLVHGGSAPMRVTVQETDLSVYAEGLTAEVVKDAVIAQRGYLEGYIRRFPRFAQTLVPWPEDSLAPLIVQEMIKAGQRAGVGPMAAVAGAMAERVGTELLGRTDEVIIENGGDVFIKTERPLTVGVFAGNSPLNLKVGLQIHPSESPTAVCTSSGSVGHSLSKGNADAVCVICASCALADAAATAICNRVVAHTDIEPAIQWGRSIKGIEGILIIFADKMGMWGRIQLKPLKP